MDVTNICSIFTALRILRLSIFLSFLSNFLAKDLWCRLGVRVALRGNHDLNQRGAKAIQAIAG